jgi:phosphoglycolate phosphatase
MNKYKLVIFDWDGTLANSIPVVVDVFQKTAQILNLGVPAEKTIEDLIGREFSDIAQSLFPNIDMNIFTPCYNKVHAENCLKIDLFDQAAETLNYLHSKGYQLAIATNRQRNQLKQMLDRFNLNHLFDAIRCGDDGHVKPDPEMLRGIFNELSIPAQDAILIGDSQYDMQLAKNAGIDVIAAGYGTQGLADLLAYSPTMLINKINELQKLL